MKIAVIPARGGSKRIPRKNIKDFCGKPMIAWSIEAAIRSECFDEIVVSTDDEEIAEIAKQYGASVPFMRPKELADDYAGTIPVVRHAIHEVLPTPTDEDLICCIYATAPFLSSLDIRQGLVLLRELKSNFAMAIAKFPAPIQRSFYIEDNQHLRMFDEKHFHTRSQELIPAFHDAGQFYWGRALAWLSTTNLFQDACAGVKIPLSRVQDIDDQEDWDRAEILAQLARGKNA